MFNTPILLIIFNRPDLTHKVFDAIRQQKPKYLYVAADGPRPGFKDDIVKCKEVRNIIKVDWDCELHTFYRVENRGCGLGPAEAITWFFDNIEQGIIIEDDCLPSPSLFRFFEELLNVYKNDERITQITGTNPKLRWKSNKTSYLFSNAGAVTMGCWAGWSRAWKFFDYEIAGWSTHEGKENIKANLNALYYNYYKKFFDCYCQTNQKDIWDFQWFFARVQHSTYSIVSSVNQMSNIGFREDATHTKYSKENRANLPLYNTDFPLKHPPFKIDNLYDWVIFNRYYKQDEKSLLLRIAIKFVEFLYCH